MMLHVAMPARHNSRILPRETKRKPVFVFATPGTNLTEERKAVERRARSEEGRDVGRQGSTREGGGGEGEGRNG